MNQSELSKERGVWVGSLVVLILLAPFPFTAHKESIFVVLQQGNFSVTFWSKFGEMPLLLISSRRLDVSRVIGAEDESASAVIENAVAMQTAINFVTLHFVIFKTSFVFAIIYCCDITRYQKLFR